MKVRPSSWLASVMSGRVSTCEHDRAGQVVHELAASVYYATAQLDGGHELHFSALPNLEQMFYETIARNALKASGAASMQTMEPTPAAIASVRKLLTWPCSKGTH